MARSSGPTGPRARIRLLHEELGTWDKVAAELDVSKGVAWRFANEEGYEPKDPAIRKKLGLPPIVTIQHKRDEHGRFAGRP